MSVLIISPRDVYATRRLKEEAQKLGIRVQIFDVNDLAERRFNIHPEKYDALYVRQAYPYHQAVIDLARRFVHAHKRVVDENVVSGDIGLGKWPMYQKLQDADLPTPLTSTSIAVIPAKAGILSLPGKIPHQVRNDTVYEFPLIAKWTYGFSAQHVHLVQDKIQLDQLLTKYPAEELLLQEFIKAKYEYKVITIGYKSLPIILRFKTHGSSFRPDFNASAVIPAKAGIFAQDNKIPDQVRNDTVMQVVALAEQASQLLGRELAKTDILEDENGQLYILEVNRWPGLENFETLTGYNVAGEFVNYLK